MDSLTHESGYVYLLHFDKPIAPGRHTTQHYIGHAEDLARRIGEHERGRRRGGNGCARLCEVAKERGIGFRVARLWRGGYELERRLKARKEGPALCPICSRAKAVKYAVEIPPQEIEKYLIALADRSPLRRDHGHREEAE